MEDKRSIWARAHRVAKTKETTKPKTIWCDDCGDMVCVAYPIGPIKFPDNSELTLNICIDCWHKHFKDSRKYKVASMLKLLLEK